MIVLDANLLLYAYTSNSPFHSSARRHLEAIFSDTEPVGIPAPCIHAFLRLVTNPVISGRRVSLEQAVATIDEWLSLRHVRILFPGDRHWDILKRIAGQGHAVGSLISDAVVAAIAVEYGGVIHSNDRDFARFPGVRWVNPLQP